MAEKVIWVIMALFLAGTGYALGVIDGMRRGTVTVVSRNSVEMGDDE